ARARERHPAALLRGAARDRVEGHVAHALGVGRLVHLLGGEILRLALRRVVVRAEEVRVDGGLAGVGGGAGDEDRERGADEGQREKERGGSQGVSLAAGTSCEEHQATGSAPGRGGPRARAPGCWDARAWARRRGPATRGRPGKGGGGGPPGRRGSRGPPARRGGSWRGRGPWRGAARPRSRSRASRRRSSPGSARPPRAGRGAWRAPAGR